MSNWLMQGPIKLITAQTATTESGILFLGGQCERVTVILQSTGTTSGGTVTIEEAYYTPQETPYTGTWSIIGTAINASSFTGTAQLATHLAGSYWAIRVRISGTITGGGSVSAWAWAN